MENTTKSSKSVAKTVQVLEVDKETSQIPLPESIALSEAMDFAKGLAKLADSMTKKQVYSREYPSLIQEGAICLERVLRRTFGVIIPKGTEMTLVVGDGMNPNQSTPFTWGRYQCPELSDAEFSCGFQYDPSKGTFNFSVSVEAERRFEPMVQKVLNGLAEEIAEKSPLKGMAFEVVFTDCYGDPMNVPAINPVDVRGAIRTFLEPVAQREVDAMRGRMNHPQRYIANGATIKRGVLFYGPPGTGKTATAKMLAANRGDWTFIQSSPTDMASAYGLAARLEHTLLVVEEIEKSKVPLSEQLLMLDGIHTKDKEVIFIATSNDVQGIDPKLQRPGRLDKLIEFGFLGPLPVCEFLEGRYRDYFATDADIQASAESLAGNNSIAMVESVVKTAYEYSGFTPITVEDVIVELESRARQRELLDAGNVRPDTRSELEKAAAIVAGAINPLQTHA